jgi:alkylmercury lyase-like protein
VSWASPEAQQVRTQVFETFAAGGRAPSPAELAGTTGLGHAEALAALRELHDRHALVLTAAGDAVRMAHPFSAWPMNFVVRDGDRLWWGGCAWDSFGIMAALGRPLEVTTTCPACGATLRYSAPPDAPGDLVIRLPRPAAEWWQDVVATCSSIRTFCNSEHVDEWVERTGSDPGATVPLEHMHRLALPWYGDRLDPDWQPQSREHRQRLLEETGLTGPFWRLP